MNEQQLIENYKLSKDEHDKVLNELTQKLTKGKISSSKPTIMFIIGQPGCGKSTFINTQDLSEYIIINSDEYRVLNKNSAYILEKYPTFYAKFTNYDAHKWGDELFSYFIENGYSVLREKAPTDYSLIDTIKKYSSKYEIVINVVVTGNLESLLRTRERYEKEIRKFKSAKLSNIEAHNKCYDILPDIITTCKELGITINYVIVKESNIEIKTINDNYLNELESIRNKSNILALNTYKKRINSIKESMKERNATKEQFDEINKIDNIYLGISI